ncbi:Leukocyte receptor cluster member 1 [Linnemannia elongata]|nr:Leukocyte receptor cluster member 1 [Linnemannia elongata]
MNILQHKSWHVYSQKNQDRVKRDEAKAEVEEKQTQERAIAADREHRLAVLRQRAARRYANEPAPGEQEGDDDTTAGLLAPVPNDTVAVTKTKSKGEHVNFWANLEKQDTASKKGNPEYEAEVKAKEKKWERIIATHLDSAVRGPTPWYIAPQAGSMATSRNKNDDHDFVKVREDPLQNMRSMLDKRKVAQEAKGERERSRSPSSRKRIWTSKQSQPVIKDPPESNTMAKLRMERLSREQAEKAKAMALLNPDYIDPTVHHQPAGRYNQQFNPQATTHAQSTFRSHRGDRDGRNDHRRESRVSKSPEARESHESRYGRHRDDRHRRNRDSSSCEEDRYRIDHEDKYRRSRSSSNREDRGSFDEYQYTGSEGSRRRERDRDRHLGRSSRSHHQ